MSDYCTLDVHIPPGTQVFDAIRAMHAFSRELGGATVVSQFNGRRLEVQRTDTLSTALDRFNEQP